MLMHYTYKDGARTKQRRAPWRGVVAGVGAVLLVGGGYLLLNIFSPALPIANGDVSLTAKKLVRDQPQSGENRLYIPKINVDLSVVLANGDETAALEKGALNRVPENGNPKDGGNYVLAAHRFTLGLTPAETRKKSPLYHIDALTNGDQIYVDYDGVRYAYTVIRREKVASTAVEIEKRTETNQLTLYSCDLNGPKYAREVVIAKPIGTVAWEDGKPAIKAFN